MHSRHLVVSLSSSTWMSPADVFPSVHHLMLHDCGTPCLLQTLPAAMVGRWLRVDRLTLYGRWFNNEHSQLLPYIGALVDHRRAKRCPVRTLRLQPRSFGMFMDSQ